MEGGLAHLIAPGVSRYINGGLRFQNKTAKGREVITKGRLSTFDLLALTSLDQLLFYIEDFMYLFYKTTNLI